MIEENPLKWMMNFCLFPLTKFLSFFIIITEHTFVLMFVKGGILMGKNQETTLYMDYSNEPRRDILCIDIKSFFASVEAVELKQHPLDAMIAVVSKPDNNGGLVLAASPRLKKEYNIRTGTRIYEIPKNAKIQIVEPRMALYL